MADLRCIAPTVVALLGAAVATPLQSRTIPSLAQVIDLKSFNVLPSVPTAEEYNASSVRTPLSSLRIPT